LRKSPGYFCVAKRIKIFAKTSNFQTASHFCSCLLHTLPQNVEKTNIFSIFQQQQKN
jgi:hypothetical protein